MHVRSEDFDCSKSKLVLQQPTYLPALRGLVLQPPFRRRRILAGFREVSKIESGA